MSNETEARRSSRRATLVLLLGSLALVVLVLRPLATSLFLAAILASVLWPLHRRLSRVLRGRPRLSAALLVVLVILIMVGPVVGLVTLLVREGAEAAQYVVSVLRGGRVEELIARLPDSVERAARDLLARLPTGATAPGMLGKLSGSVFAAVSATGSFIFQAAMMIVALFFFLVSKDDILDFIETASPLRHGEARELLAEMRKVSGAVLSSVVLTALVQSLVALIGYLIAGVPQAFFFAAVTFVFALVPAIGAAVVGLAAALLLLATGHLGWAIFLACWALAVVGLVDNVLKPLLVRRLGRGGGMHGGVVFFALLGGLLAFGGIGLLLGPLALALFVACLRIYRRNFAEERPSGRAAGDTAGGP